MIGVDLRVVALMEYAKAKHNNRKVEPTARSKREEERLLKKYWFYYRKLQPGDRN